MELSKKGLQNSKNFEKESEKQEKQSTKIAVSSTGQTIEDDIDMRFGRCPYFLIIEIEDKEIKDVKAIENTASAQAGGAGITAAQIVAEQKVEAIITMNAGPRAFDVFNQLNIRIYLAQGKIKDAVQDFIDGKLQEISTPTGPQHMGIGGFGAGRGAGIGADRGTGQGAGIGRRFQQQNIGKEIPGNCVCTNCNLSMPAPQGVDCSQVKCPKCGAPMRAGGTGVTPVEVKK